MIDLETHEAVFTWMLQRLADAGLVKGKTVGIDATTLAANAALRSIVRRDTGESCQDFLTKLAQASGIETPTRADLARIDRKRRRRARTTTGHIRTIPTRRSPMSALAVYANIIADATAMDPDEMFNSI